jgi:hypothetical protein
LFFLVIAVRLVGMLRMELISSDTKRHFQFVIWTDSWKARVLITV